jgi:glycosyltransferase involved in cell wall biosynthesis
MRVAIVAPMAVPLTWGGAERAVDGLKAAIETHRGHPTEVVKVPVDERDLPGVVAAYRDFSNLDLSAFDEVVSVKYPAWIAPHPNHTVLMFHPLRGLYDTYHTFGLPVQPAPQSPQMASLYRFMARHHDRAALPEFFTRFSTLLGELGPGHPDLAFPAPMARVIVHWLDDIALSPTEIRRHYALSRTVANRPEYFPAGVRPRVVYLPGDLPEAPARVEVGRHLFTASRLDGAKRIDLIVDAMAHVHEDVPLLIAGTGPLRESLEARAAHDPRIRFLGFVPDDELLERYRQAIAVPFVPDDEDLGLISLEAFAQAVPVITTTDSGGPTEFVADGITGLVTDPDPWSLGRAMNRLARDPGTALTMGAEAQRRGRRVSWERAVDELFPTATASSGATDDPVARVAALAASAIDHASSAPTAATDGRGPEHRPKVVVLATFPIDAPAHGGQLRARNLYGQLSATVDVHLVALTDRSAAAVDEVLAPGLRQTIVPRSLEQASVDDATGLDARLPVTDILSGQHSSLTPAFGRTLDGALADADLVILAEPYLLPALHAAARSVPFVYDAYNVEADLKDAALPDTPIRSQLLEDVDRIERAAVTESAAVVTCSDADAALLAGRYHRNRTSFEVIPNGTTVPASIPTPEARAAAGRRWLERYRRDGGVGDVEHLAVFFGSWHPPNLDAAELIVEIAPLLPEVLFLSCGNHGAAFADRRLPSNVVFPGAVGATAKTALLASAAVALNPMRTGSGTNLKLVEYLAAGVPVVSTPFGARGVDVADHRDLLLAPPECFADAIAETLTEPAAAAARATVGRQVATEGYGWPSLGDRLAVVVADLVAATPRK